jgi:lipopolysaccharide export system protein LptA
VRSGDQKVSADRGDFNMLKQTVKLTGNVLITQGTNVVSGCVLEVNLKTSSAVLKPCKNGIIGRPQMLFSTKNAGKKN